ncbi:hypothetical protein A2239_03110 [Candidatus Uhrbacteria bacterium RIFOXYA2_FULL_40_9]|nr:MAG: hypothetical protein A2239_03110 [Candidatus Uhrbacteria bacterium RIFOXYA2_FULL_40_9]OGL97179.1 MAG: hypothetical protein A2332_00630 [Candidatus Uhrbacteria bacterium RIFOXYB2_FULL_41_18]
MYYITFITVGKQKNGSCKNLVMEYQKRLKLFVKLQTIEIAETPFSSERDRNRVLAQEAEKIIKVIPHQSLVITLDAKGKEFDSPAFAKKIEEWSKQGVHHLTFLLGGPLGLHDTFKKENVFSLSQLTFPHDLAHVLFLEQLYRAMTILKGKTYHY